MAMASYQYCPPKITRQAYAQAQRNAGLPFVAAWLTDTTAVTPACVTGPAQPTDPGVAAAVRHSLGQWP
jgi:hypothetical protein